MLLLLLFNLVFSPQDTLRSYRAQDVVVTATRSPIRSIDAPSTVSRIDISQLRDSGIEDANAVLSSVNGIFIKENGPGQLNTISLRGTSAEQTLFMMDGVSLNNVQNGLVDLFLIPTNDIASVEISQGGASALYGANAVGGVVNLETRSPNDNSLRLDLGGGSFGRQNFGGELSGVVGPVRVDLTANRSRAVNNYDFTYDNGGVSTAMQRSGADYLADNQSLKLVLPSTVGTTSLFVQNLYADRGTPGMVTDPAFVGTARETDRNTIAILRNTGILGGLNYSASAGAIYSYLHYTDPAYESNDYYKMLSFQPSVQATYADGNFTSTGGVDAEIDRGESNEMTGIKNRDRWGAFLTGMYEFLKGYNLETRIFGAVRYDGYSDFGGSFNPKAGINIKPLASAPVHLRASAGTSYRVPTFNDLYYAGLGNTSLKPEMSTEYDAGLVGEINRGNSPIALTFDVSYYHIDVRNGIVWRPVSAVEWLPENYGRILSKGVEVGADLYYGSLLRLKGNYSSGESVDLSDPSDPTTYEKQQLYIPKHQSYLMIQVTPGIFNVTADVRYVGTRYYSTDNSSSISPFAVASLSASARVDAGVFVIYPKAMVDNLFNRNYQVLPLYPVPMRNYRFELTFEFKQGK